MNYLHSPPLRLVQSCHARSNRRKINGEKKLAVKIKLKIKPQALTEKTTKKLAANRISWKEYYKLEKEKSSSSMEILS
ncbi:hypothetical protein T03_9002 [Trichinella britovi]|uniref:Uncharacterized protein n=1 Tax=Trichinella britovi TaxID=45882 RepID=A0A0V1D7S0_TRIBR|nr:hypothetical protein T03_9002 [Trichinella britovi]